MSETLDQNVDEDESELGASGSARIVDLMDLMDRIDVDAGVQAFSRWVRDHPLAAVGGAMAVGFVVASMIRPGKRTTGPGGVLRQTAAEVGRELESQAVDYRHAAANKIAAVASSVIGKNPGDPVRSQATGLLTDTVRTAVTALALNKLSEWLRRSA